MAATVTARQFVKQLEALSSPEEVEYVGRFFRGNDDGGASDNKIMGVAFGKVFSLAKKLMRMPLAEIEKLLDNPFYEVFPHATCTFTLMNVAARSEI